jgi:hypothetical protein
MLRGRKISLAVRRCALTNVNAAMVQKSTFRFDAWPRERGLQKLLEERMIALALNGASRDR